MKNFLIFAAITCLAWQAAGQQIILDLEQQRFAAQVSKNRTAMEAILSDDLVYTHSSGVVEDKKTFIDNVMSRKWDYRSIKAEDQKVRMYGGKTAVVTGLAVMLVGINGVDTPLRLRYTVTYIKKNGKWQMVVWLSTRLPS